MGNVVVLGATAGAGRAPPARDALGSVATTPHDRAVAETVCWFRER